MNINKNYQSFMNFNVDKFIGEWIAICDEKIISHGKSFKNVFNEAKKKCIIILCRTRPNESSSSYILEGILKRIDKFSSI